MARSQSSQSPAVTRPPTLRSPFTGEPPNRTDVPGTPGTPPSACAAPGGLAVTRGGRLADFIHHSRTSPSTQKRSGEGGVATGGPRSGGPRSGGPWVKAGPFMSTRNSKLVSARPFISSLPASRHFGQTNPFEDHSLDSPRDTPREPGRLGGCPFLRHHRKKREIDSTLLAEDADRGWQERRILAFVRRS